MKRVREPAKVLVEPCKSNYARWTKKLLEPSFDFKILDINVLDLTFGRGRMWGCLKNKVHITAFDIVKWPWEVEPEIFIQKPAWEWKDYVDKNKKIHVVAVDPPWAIGKRGKEIHGRKEFQTILGSPKQILDAAVEAAGYFHAYLLVHWKKEFLPKCK